MVRVLVDPIDVKTFVVNNNNNGLFFTKLQVVISLPHLPHYN